MGFISFFRSAVVQEKIICLFPATGRKIGQYFFIQISTIYYITDKKRKKTEK